MARFGRAHPAVALSLALTEDPRGAMRTDRWDVLVHVGRLPDLDVARRKLASNRRLLCAARAYADRHGLPEAPDALRGHRCGVACEDGADATLWALAGPGGARASVRVEPAFASTDGEVVRAWALDGRRGAAFPRPAPPGPARGSCRPSRDGRPPAPGPPRRRARP